MELTKRSDDRPKRAAGRRGQGTLEFALVLPIIVALLFGLFDLGRAVYAFSTISNAARAASRIAIVDQNTSTDCATYSQSAPCVASREAVSLTVDPASVILSFKQYDLSGPCSPLAVGCVAEVTVPYTYRAITPVLTALVGSVVLSSTTRLPIERVCDSSVSTSACYAGP